MRIAFYIAIGLMALLVVMAYSCCVIAGQADEKAKKMYRMWKESRDERG